MVRLLHLVPRESVVCPYPSVSTGDPLGPLVAAEEIAAIMINHVFRIHGFPRDIVSDRGPQFVLRFWRKFCRLIGVTVSLTSGYQPESKGQTEHLNQQLETDLLCQVSQNPLTWRKHLVWVKT